MSIIIGPFSPTATNAQFNDQLYLQSGAYIIHNPTSYQLTFKKADSNRFIVDPGTVRTVHKVGGNSGNVEWTAALVGPLAILNTPGFTIEILQQGVDRIPDEAIVSLSQIATQQPRVLMLPTAPVNTFAGSTGNLASAGRTALITVPLAGVTQWALDAHNFAEVYLYYIKAAPVLPAAATVNYLYDIEVEGQTAANAVIGGPIPFYRGFGLAAQQGTTVAALTVDEYNPGSFVLGAGLFFTGTPGAPLDHIVFFLKNLASVTLSYNVTMMVGVDLINSGGVPPAIGEPSPAALIAQYTGTVF